MLAVLKCSLRSAAASESSGNLLNFLAPPPTHWIRKWAGEAGGSNLCFNRFPWWLWWKLMFENHCRLPYWSVFNQHHHFSLSTPPFTEERSLRSSSAAFPKVCLVDKMPWDSKDRQMTHPSREFKLWPLINRQYDAPYLSSTVLAPHRFAISIDRTLCPQLSLYRPVVEDAAHDKMQWLHCGDNRGNSSHDINFFMSKHIEAALSHISLLSGPLENSQICNKVLAAALVLLISIYAH